MSEDQTSKLDSDSDSIVDLSLLKELGKSALVDALNSVNGAKTLVLDPSLAGPLGLLTEVSLLKHHGVDKMFWLESGPLTVMTSNIVYLCRPKIKWIKIIADQVKRLSHDEQSHSYTLLLVPRLSTLVTRILEEEGVLGDISVSAFNLQFIYLEDDVISLENENTFKELWVDGDETVIYDSAEALITFQKLYGLIPRIVGKGDYAARLSSLLSRLSPDVSRSKSTPETLMTPSEKIDSLIVLDRRVDMITPLLTQLTYEGLIDELVGIKNSHVELPISLLSPPNPASATSATSSTPGATAATAVPSAKEKKKKHCLSASTDGLLAELRDCNFSTIGRRLNKTARRLDEDYRSRLQARTVAQLRDFVGKLGGLQNEHQSLRLHTGLSEMLVPLTRSEQFNKALEIQQNLLSSYDPSAQIAAIEDMVVQGADMQIVLRLLCLASLTNGGIKAKTLENLKREILQSYGYDQLPLLLSLASPSLAILLPNPLPATTPPSVASSKLPFSYLRKSLRLVVDEPEDADEPEDISYVYSGYAPMSVRLVQCVAQKGSVLSTPASSADDGETSRRGKGVASASTGKVRAHPIIGWKGFEDVIATLPGETIDVVQRGFPGADATVPSSGAIVLPRAQTMTTVVFFLGGCTYTEIAALRWVGKQSRGRRILIATTNIINGAGIINSISGGTKAQNVPSREAGL